MKKYAVAVALMFLTTNAMAQDSSGPAGDAKRGEQHFMSDGCWECHGVGGGGAALTGPRLARTGLPFEAFIAQIRHPSSDMPPFGPTMVSDQAVADIYAYVKSRPEANELKSLPLLQGMGVK